MKSKITATLEGEQIKVHAEYSIGKEKVHEINTAFPLDTSEEVIREEVEKAGALFTNEQKQKVEQVKVDKKFGNAQILISNLNK